MQESRSSQRAIEALYAIGRRWRIVVPFALVTPSVVLALASSTPKLYESSADVLLNNQALTISQLRGSSIWTPRRNFRTQARVARVPELARRVVAAAEVPALGPFGFLSKSFVVGDGETDLLTFYVRDESPHEAARLATLYASEYIAYRNDLDTRSLRRAISVIGRQLERSREQGNDPSVYANLVRQQQQLTMGLATIETNATLVRPGSMAVDTASRPLDSAVRGLILGFVVGVGLAGLAHLLDPRVRTAAEIAEELRLPLVGRLPLEKGRRRPNAFPLQRSMSEQRADAVRALRASLRLDQLGEHSIVLVTSGVGGEGKTTTVADLAVALATAGRTVVLVDLDLRRPALAGLFRVPQTPGIADVVQGTAKLDDAIRLVRFDQSPDASLGETTVAGSLQLVPAGASLWAEGNVYMSGQALHSVLESLRMLADVVLLDGPSMLEGGDALALSQLADALLVIASMRRFRPSEGRELARLLTFSPARPLGVVVIGEPYDVGTVTGYAAEARGAHRSHAFGRV